MLHAMSIGILYVDISDAFMSLQPSSVVPMEISDEYVCSLCVDMNISPHEKDLMFQVLVNSPAIEASSADSSFAAIFFSLLNIFTNLLI